MLASTVITIMVCHLSTIYDVVHFALTHNHARGVGEEEKDEETV